MPTAQSLLLSDQSVLSNQSEVALPDPDDTPATSSPGVDIATEQWRHDASARWPKAGGARGFGTVSARRAGKSPGSASRFAHTIVRFGLAMLVGVAGTLAWQSYGGQVQALVRTLAPSLGPLVPPAPADPAGATPGALSEELKPIALDLVVVRKAVEQIAADQQQLAARNSEMAQNIKTLQATEQGLTDKISALPAAKPIRASAPTRRALPHAPLPLTAQ